MVGLIAQSRGVEFDLDSKGYLASSSYDLTRAQEILVDWADFLGFVDDNDNLASTLYLFEMERKEEKIFERIPDVSE